MLTEARHPTPVFGSLREPIRSVAQKGAVLLAGVSTLVAASIPSDRDSRITAIPVNPNTSGDGQLLQMGSQRERIVCHVRGEADASSASLFIAQEGDYVYIPPSSGKPNGGWTVVVPGDVNHPPENAYADVVGPNGEHEWLKNISYDGSPALANEPCSVPARQGPEHSTPNACYSPSHEKTNEHNLLGTFLPLPGDIIIKDGKYITTPPEYNGIDGFEWVPFQGSTEGISASIPCADQ